jgi:GTP cyclohydrolase I
MVMLTEHVAEQPAEPHASALHAVPRPAEAADHRQGAEPHPPLAGAQRAEAEPADPRPGTTDLARAEAAVADLLEALGRDTTDEHLRDTPRRVAAAFTELLTARDFEMTTFPNDEGYGDLVIVRDIPFHSLCQHHLLPFRGVAHIGYVPGDRLVGLSKLARVLERFARDLQVQERLTRQVANYLTERLSPRGVGVVLEAEHLCMSMRGVQSEGALTVTSAFGGVLSDDGPMRRRFERP